MADLHFEKSAIDEGWAFANYWVSEYGARPDIRHHLILYLAFLDRESGFDLRQIFDWFGRELGAKFNSPATLKMLCDNASLLWRCHFSGE